MYRLYDILIVVKHITKVITVIIIIILIVVIVFIVDIFEWLILIFRIRDIDQRRRIVVEI